MKVSQLIARLQYMPPDTTVVVDGYEGGVHILKRVRRMYLERNVRDYEWAGRHDVSRSKAASAEVCLPTKDI